MLADRLTPATQWTKLVPFLLATSCILSHTKSKYLARDSVGRSTTSNLMDSIFLNSILGTSLHTVMMHDMLNFIKLKSVAPMNELKYKWSVILATWLKKLAIISHTARKKNKQTNQTKIYLDFFFLFFYLFLRIFLCFTL